MSHNHTDSQFNDLERIHKRIEAGKVKKVQAETRISSMQEQYQKISGEMKEIGMDPKTAEETIKQAEMEIAKEMEEIMALLPDGI